MRRGIYDTVIRFKHPRQIFAVIRTEGKLKYLHSGEGGVCEKLANVVGYISKVLGNYLTVGESRLYSVEKLFSGSIAPLSVYSVFSISGNREITCKATEMVNPQKVVQRECATDSVYPPSEALVLHLLPIVYRVAPLLTCCGICIRRTSRNNRRVVIFVKQELVGGAPDVHAVVRDINRHISYYHDTL